MIPERLVRFFGFWCCKALGLPVLGDLKVQRSIGSLMSSAMVLQGFVKGFSKGFIVF